MATVVRLKRRKNEIVQNCDVYIGRACYMGGWKLPQSKWHNPFPIKGNREECLQKYKEYVLSNADLMRDLPELSGKVLGCWCKPERCHGDILVELLHKKKDD